MILNAESNIKFGVSGAKNDPLWNGRGDKICGWCISMRTVEVEYSVYQIVFIVRLTD